MLDGSFAMELLLNPSQSLFQALSNISPVGIFQADARGFYVYVNQRWCEMTGLTPTAAYGDGWTTAVDSADRERVGAEWESAVRGKTRFEAKFRFKRGDGTLTWVYGQAVPHGSAEPGREGYIGTVTDLTRVVESEIELRNTKEQYQLLFESNPLPGWVFDV